MNVAEIATARLIGAVFVERGVLSESQIRVALEIQRETGQQLGQILVERFGVTRKELASVVAEQWADIGRSSPPGLDAAANESWRRLGEIFVERGFVTPEQLEQALQRQRETGERVGEALVAQGSISKFELAGALAEQMSALEEAAAAGRPEPPDATVVSLASRLEESAPVDEQPPASTSTLPPDAPQPADDQAAASARALAARLEDVTAPADEEALAPRDEEASVPDDEQVLALMDELPVAPRHEPVLAPTDDEVPIPMDELVLVPDAEPVPGPTSALPSQLEAEAPAERQLLASARALAERLEEARAPHDDRSFAPDSVPEPRTLSVVQQEPVRSPASGWVAFASTTTGYRLAHVDGDVPSTGETIDVPDVGEVVVLRLGRSPLPGDERACVYLEQLVRADAALAG